MKRILVLLFGLSFIGTAFAAPGETIRIGMIGLDTSHVPAFAKIFNNPDATGDLSGFKVVAAYPGGTDLPASRDRVKGFTQQLRDMGIEIVDTIPQLLEKIDVVLLESVDGRIHLQEARPVILAGKPMFIDKPLAGSLADAIAIAELARKHQTPWFSSSSLRYIESVQSLRTNKALGEITGAQTWGPCSYQEGTPDMFFYGIHGIEPLFALMGTGCETVSRVQAADADVVTGVWKGGRVGTYRGIRRNKAEFGAVAFGTRGIVHTSKDGGYEEMCREIGKFFKTRQSPIDPEETIEIFAFMEAADESKRRGGAPVTLREVLEKARSAVAKASVRFEKQVLTRQYFCDGINTGDFNRDGKPDIVAGPYWYAGPDFQKRHAFYPASAFETAPNPTDSLFSYVHDFNGDGWADILVLGRVHLHQAFWYENPKGEAGHWKKHFAFHRVQGESPPFLDVDADGKPELVAHWENHWGLIQPNWSQPAETWTFRPVTGQGNWPHFYHGEGIGDVNGDGRLDLIINEGWWEQPLPGSGEMKWTEHPFLFSKAKGGSQMFAYDVDGDGDQDVISALDAHGWGLAWFEQVKEDGHVRFNEHKIMGDRSEEAQYGVAFSQPHALALADMNGDGLRDIVVGKRLWAHGPAGDVEPNAAPVLYWFELTRGPGSVAQFVPHLVDEESGVGTQITVADVNGDQRLDILTVSKLGSFAFLNRPDPD